jgi:4-methylaminobutanoate oxidase (formaldehyde-forming)
MGAAAIRVGPAPVWAQRVSYAGEAGYELWVEPAWAVPTWDRLRAAGADHGLEPCGYRCLDGLRIEKGFRYLGSDLTAGDTPLEAGIERFVSFDGRDFIGRPALEDQRERGVERRLRTILIGDGAEYLPIYGGEAVTAGAEVVGRLRSAAYAFTVGRNAGLAYLPVDLTDADDLSVEVFGEQVAATLAEDVLVASAGRTAA